MPHRIHNVVRRLSLRLINDEGAVKRRRLWLARHSYFTARRACPSSFPSEAAQCAQCVPGEVQRKVQLRHAAKLQPFDELPPDVSEACSSALIASDCSLLLPCTLYEHARMLHVGWTRTSLAITLPSRRGSFNSPASMALIS